MAASRQTSEVDDSAVHPNLPALADGHRLCIGGPIRNDAVEEWQPAPQSEDMLRLDEALSKLEQADGRAATVVELRFFGGLRE